MNQTLTFIVFFTIVITVVASGHLYFYRRLVRDTFENKRWRRVGLIAIVALFLLTIAGTALSRMTVGTWLTSFTLAGLLWLGFAFYLLLFFGLIDAIRLTAWLRRRFGKAQASATSPIEQSRRRFLARSGAAVGALGAGAVSVRGVSNAWGDFEEPVVEVALERLPKAFEGLKIVQVSDVHIGPTLDGGFIKRIVERVNELKPDIVAITGDLVDGRVHQIGDEVKGLGNLESRFGSFFCSGNHEFYSNADEWLPFLQEHNVKVLGNQRVEIRDGNAVFDLAGIHDHRAFKGYEPAIGKIIKGRDTDRELVLLAHQPVQIDLAVKAGAGLQLSGHTHGGQVFPFGYLTALAQPYLKGLHRHDATTQIYVNSGTGYWGPPLRIGAPPEITQIVLTSA